MHWEIQHLWWFIAQLITHQYKPLLYMTLFCTLFDSKDTDPTLAFIMHLLKFTRNTTGLNSCHKCTNKLIAQTKRNRKSIFSLQTHWEIPFREIGCHAYMSHIYKQLSFHVTVSYLVLWPLLGPIETTVLNTICRIFANK